MEKTKNVLLLLTCFVIFGVLNRPILANAAEESFEEVLQNDDSFFTVKSLEEYSWEELKRTNDMVSMSAEDDACLTFIYMLAHPKQNSQNEPYINIRLGCPVEEPYSFRMHDKITTILNCFLNENEEYGFDITTNVLEEDNFYIMSNNCPFELSTLGKKVQIYSDVEYYESSVNFGSGRLGRGQKWLNGNSEVYINGISYLNQKGEIEYSEYFPLNLLLENPVSITSTNSNYMVHICTVDGLDLGWTHPNNILAW